MATVGEVAWARFQAHAEWVAAQIAAHGEPVRARTFKTPADATGDGAYGFYILDADATLAQEADLDRRVQAALAALD